MNLKPNTTLASSRQTAFTLVEVLVGMALMGVVFVSLFAGLSSGTALIQMTRENLRATQIMVEKTETARLYTWDQITSGTNIPSSFMERYYPVGPTNGNGLLYFGTVTVTNAGTATDYDDDMRLIIVTVNWTNGLVPRTRSSQTYVARNGMQNYIF